jgi:peptide-methionine (S)-S-oxide reductase
MTPETQVAVFGGGCFWCTEAVFGELEGVVSVMPGYAGGLVKNPTYEQVCSGRTGHAEVIRIEFKPSQIAFNDLLTVFFATHDPTTLNRQGDDVGTQYRSVVLYADEQQKQEAESRIRELNAASSFSRPIVTTIEPLTAFYPAEDYHQKFYARNPFQPYCQFTIPPKLAKLHKQFTTLLKAKGENS